ncbi:MAG: CoA transferase [Actinomycetospora chiangmaiensis]|nr:CoA transferase [Actinomycetospora chiangmaiensis]
MPRPGPLSGLRIVEFAGIGPAPMAAMLFADLGADVLRLDRTTPGDLGIARPDALDLTRRGRPSVAIDLKDTRAVALVHDLLAGADALVEGFRPGTMERMGFGPEAVLDRNPRLVYGRMTGWGQSGPLAKSAGHDLNYLALTGALAAIGRAEGKPVPPLNLVADMGGGALYLAFGVACALIEAGRTGRGQVVDAAMTDGAASLMTTFYGLFAAGLHSLERGANLLDSGSALYDTYECRDGRFVSIAPIEPRFRAEFFRLVGVPAGTPDDARLRERLTELFLTRTRAEWCAVLEGTDACFAPVLTMAEAADHPHNAARGTFVTVEGVTQPAPAPRFSRTPAVPPSPPQRRGQGTRHALAAWGIAADRIETLVAAGVLAVAEASAP